jgi:methylated-DNA-[protein]-cysteine S-methyltransferase
MTTTLSHVFPSPIGDLLLVSNGAALTGLYLPNYAEKHPPDSRWRRDKSPFETLCAQLAEYFAGRLYEFDVALAPEGTEFQVKVWRELQRIPFGETISYGEVARRIGRPTASRAVGHANGLNPISIIVPCHRVIGADGTLTGYGGGLDRKKWLLEHEAAAARGFVATPPAGGALWRAADASLV